METDSLFAIGWRSIIYLFQNKALIITHNNVTDFRALFIMPSMSPEIDKTYFKDENIKGFFCFFSRGFYYELELKLGKNPVYFFLVKIKLMLGDWKEFILANQNWEKFPTGDQVLLVGQPKFKANKLPM